MPARPPTTFSPLPPEVEVQQISPRIAPAGASAKLAPDLLAVVITFHRRDGLRRLVASLCAQSALPGRVMVVDNGREPATVMALEELSATGCTVVLVTPPRNVGPAGATAFAMALALEAVPSGAGWLAILNDDLVFSNTTILERMLAFARASWIEDSSVAAVGRIGHRFDRAWARLRRPPEADRPSLPAFIDVDYLTTGSARGGMGQPVPMLRLAAVREVGPFWAELFIGMTEVEYGLRLRRAGYRLVANGEMWRQDRPPDLPPEAPAGAVERTPQRRYYSARNLVVVARFYGRWWTGAWVTGTRVGARMLWLLRRPSLLMLSHLSATVLGVADGWRLRLGERTIASGRTDGAGPTASKPPV